MRRILITGGAGFIGSNIAAGLAARGTHHIVICDALGSDEKWRNLRHHAVYEIIPPSSLFQWLQLYGETVEAVIHMGAISSTTERDVDRILENNLTFSTLLYRWCAENGNRLIYASSAATYGDGGQGFDDDASLEHLARLMPLNPYGWSKQLVDRYVALSAQAGEPAPAQCVGLKFFNVYGPNEYHKGDQKSVVCTKFPLARAGEAITLFASDHPGYEDGGQLRDFIYVEDCVNVVEWFFDHPELSGLYNVGTGAARSFRDLATALFQALGQKPRIAYVPMPEPLRGAYQYFTQSQMARLLATGYPHAFTTLEDGVAHYVARYLTQEDPYR